MADFLRASSITSSTLWLSYDLTGLGEWELLRQYKQAPQAVEELAVSLVAYPSLHAGIL